MPTDCMGRGCCSGGGAPNTAVLSTACALESPGRLVKRTDAQAVSQTSGIRISGHSQTVSMLFLQLKSLRVVRVV